MNKLDELKAQIAELQRLIALVESYKEGEQWQYRPRTSNPEQWKWEDCNGEPRWSLDSTDYRKKPELAVIYINRYNGEWGKIHDSPDIARNNATSGAVRVAVKFVEVSE